MKRRRAREYTVQLLYMLDTAGPGSLGERSSQNLMDLYLKHYRPDGETADPDLSFWKRLLDQSLSRLNEIDSLIESQSEHWKLQRMTRVDRSILRVAVAELLAFPEISAAVTIDEALEISKRFGTEESAPFVNGVLDNLWKKVAPHTPKSSA